MIARTDIETTIRAERRIARTMLRISLCLVATLAASATLIAAPGEAYAAKVNNGGATYSRSTIHGGCHPNIGPIGPGNHHRPPAWAC